MAKAFVRRLKGVIFDLDGTLLDTLADLAGAMNGALRVLGYKEHPTSAYRRFVGDGVDVLARRALPADCRDEETVGRCVEQMRRVYAVDWAVHTKPYKGIATTLDALAAARVPTAVLSNKPHDMTVKIVEALLGDWTFERVDGARAGIPKKPDPTGALATCRAMGLEPDEVAYVGDTDTDMKTAIAAGMYSVGALWGFREVQELRAAGARTTIERPEDLLPLVISF